MQPEATSVASFFAPNGSLTINHELEGYEVVLVTADKKEVEVMVAPDGRILEDSGDEK